MTPKLGFCQCSDPGCAVHKTKSACGNIATISMFRIDTDDTTGTAMCDDCATDAFECGLFESDLN